MTSRAFRISIAVLAFLLSGIAQAPDAAGVAAERGVTAAQRKLIRVGPQHSLTRIAEAAKIARDGDVVAIESGDYVMDVAAWRQSNLTIRAERCCARLIAAGKSAEGKAIWVVKGDNIL